MPYDDRSNYEKGGAEEFFVIRYSSVQCLDEITQKATQRREGPLSLIEDPSRGPQAIFSILLRDQNRGNATRQQNAIGCLLGGCNRWPLIISNYILFYIACNLWRCFSLLKLKAPTKVKFNLHWTENISLFRNVLS